MQQASAPQKTSSRTDQCCDIAGDWAGFNTTLDTYRAELGVRLPRAIEGKIAEFRQGKRGRNRPTMVVQSMPSKPESSRWFSNRPHLGLALITHCLRHGWKLRRLPSDSPCSGRRHGARVDTGTIHRHRRKAMIQVGQIRQHSHRPRSYPPGLGPVFGPNRR